MSARAGGELEAALRPTSCPICGDAPAVELFPASFRADDLNATIFSARRRPDRIHYRLVQCSGCGLVRSDPVADTELLNRLYEKSEFNYGSETECLRRTYGRYLDLLHRSGESSALLEIGAGNGFFLEEALARGYARAAGVEPSEDAISQAPPAVRPLLVPDVFREGLFAPGTFDAVCLFQVFDHLPEPVRTVDEIRRVLKPRGRVLFYNHDVESWSARLLGERSPIFDVEHTHLYSRATLRRLLESRGFDVVREGSGWNTYTVQYLAHLVPLPRPLRSATARLLSASRLGQGRLTVPLGNLYVVAEPRP